MKKYIRHENIIKKTEESINPNNTEAIEHPASEMANVFGRPLNYYCYSVLKYLFYLSKKRLMPILESQKDLKHQSVSLINYPLTIMPEEL